jgi:hypothetical protein
MPLPNLEPPAAEGAFTARERFAAGPLPTWVVPCSFPEGVKAKPGAPVTHLLLSRQMHAEQRQMCLQSAVRLETMEAVQHESQWRVQFEPRTQHLCLHWIRIRRGDKVFEHANLDQFRVLQREEALEGFVVDGCCTLLLLLEDVRPGDILESAYTLTTEPRILADHCWSFYCLPPHVAVGRFYHSLKFGNTRQMQWKAAEGVRPEVQKEGQETSWVWSDMNYSGSAPEPNTPDWCIENPWLQVSDCHDWQTVAAGFAAVWQEEPDAPELKELIEGIKEREESILSRIECALRLVQDEFRYLSVDLEVGGHVPAPPGVVAHRRYGDCKDLSFLLVHLLRGLGVKARPILVNSRLKKGIEDKLPMPGLFDHVIVEFEVAEGIRWVDPTLRSQGGGCLNRVIADYGAGLPIDPKAGALVKAPASALNQSAFELKESLLLDTKGGPSLLAISVRASGTYAENLRQQFECCSVEEIARERLEACRQRFGTVGRQGELQFRNDRDTNQFWIAEMFEIPTALIPAGETPETIRFSLPSNIILSSLGMPDVTNRRTPLALPYPSNLTHVIELSSPGIALLGTHRQQIGNERIRFVRSHKTMAGFWSVSFQLTTLQDSVPPEELQEHRRMLQEISRESQWDVALTVGFARPRQRGDFGALPPPPRKPGTTFIPTAPTVPLKPKTSTTGMPTKSAASVRSRRSSSHRSRLSYHEEMRLFRRKQKQNRWLWIGIILVVVAALVGIFVLAARV